MKKRIYTIPNLLFVLLLITIFIPYSRLDSVVTVKSPIVLVAVLIFIEVFYQIQLRKEENVRSANDITTFLFALLLIWEIATTKLNLLPHIFVPSLENIFYVFIEQWELILSGFVRSMGLLIVGFALALSLGISLGLVVGWIPRLRKAIFPIAKAVSTVPAMIYTPYIVMLLPTFTQASIFVIFCGIFWPTFMNVINNVGTMDKKIIDSARVLNVGLKTMLFKIILPYTLPRIINNLSIMLSISFMTLTAAEMMGADRGMGYFVKRFSEQINYTNALAGILFIAVVITIANYLIGLLKKALVKWSF